MSKVYVLVCENDTEYEREPSVLGVFNNKKKAIQYAKDCINDDDMGWHYEAQVFFITEYDTTTGQPLTEQYKLFDK